MSDVNLKTPVGSDLSKRVGGVDEDDEKKHSPRLNGRGVVSRSAQSHSDDTDGQSSGNDSAGQEASPCSSNNGKESAIEATESKSSNSHSPSPPSSSAAYSLLSGSSEQDQPSTSGCSSDQPARQQTQKELLKALHELKIRVPAEQRGKGRSSTLASLQYALNCVKQVRANQEYYHQWSVEESHGCCLDLSAFTIEELDNITSEYTLQNTDTFSVAVSFLSGKVVYISPQASSLLRCKPERLQGTVFSELLAPQDVSTFYSSTAPCRLPPWASCTRAASSVDCAQEKSMFCRISGERESGGEMKYYPFRLTPYQLTLRDSDTAQPEPCCLLITERVHSGYEAPRIPADKRIFTTSHTPSCLFQEVDERAVPLLGYLPQDLVGTPLLLYLHPEDRPLMVDIHKKIVQYAGQPFDHSPLRMCARSGEYLTMDTSWSSFINPWSRKVAFIVGRHKVRTSPLNEDVFTAPEEGEVRAMSPEVPQFSEQIHRLLVQPVHNSGGGSGSQGYSSLGSSGSRELQPSAASSSDSMGAAAEEPPHSRKLTFQQMCKDVHMVKTSGQQLYAESRNRPPPRKQASSGGVVKAAEAESTSKENQRVATIIPKAQASTQLPRKEIPATYSYQQINCLDSIIRYLESCNVPNTVKRKCGSSSCTTSSASDDDKWREAAGPAKDIVETLEVAEMSKVVPAEPTHPLTPLALHYKAESVVSVTSQCSFSSTIVHVGDKKPPESDIVMMEETPITPTPAPSTAAPQNSTTSPTGAAAQPAASPSPAEKREKEQEGRRGGAGVTFRGLTKEVLSTHTQQEEQAFLNRFRDLSQLPLIQSSPPQRRQTATPAAKGVRSSQNYPSGGGSGRRRGRGGKRLKHQAEVPLFDTPSLSTSGPSIPPRSTAEGPSAPAFSSSQHLSGASSSPWPTSVGSQASGPPIMTPYPPGCMPFYSLYPPFPVPQMEVDPRMQAAFSCPQQGPRFPVQASQMFPSMAPPVMAFILPNCMFPQLNGATAPIQHLAQAMPLPAQLNPQFNPAVAQVSPAVANFNPTLGQFNPLAPQINPTQPLAVPPQFYNPNLMFGFQNGATASTSPNSAAPPPRGPSRSSTPQSTGQPAGDNDGTGSPLFHSRCSSPLNLLQLEELPSNRTDVTQQTPPPVGGASQGPQTSGTRGSSKDNGDVNDSNQDAMSTSSDLLDLLLQEDSRSGTGSAASGSGSSGSGSGSSGSGSNGCSTSGSGTRSSNTSKYFGSIDSSENDHGHKQASGDSGEEQFIKYVLQDPIWLVMANTDEKVMMTYQLPKRDIETVLREDREVMKTAKMQQPHFTEKQKKELSQVHPWIQSGCLPKAINITSCRGCGSPTESSSAPPFDVELHDMDLTRILREEGDHMTAVTADSQPDSPQSSETAQKEAQANTAHTEALNKAVEEAEVTSSSSVEVKRD
ncbi:period circadian protein homolog 1a [Salminus brasiliensis]|uniref:period circadian protein homolog 1a n=1 Tax=Salminus brasiliensis TaxID=930266 RepID=UPI003B82E125